MRIRVSKITRNGTTHEYTQIVESYRRADGMPATRVIASLGQLSVAERDNLKAAVDASRLGRHVVAQSAPGQSASRLPLRPTSNLRYLDVAVLLELWRDWKLTALLDETMPPSKAEVPPAEIVAALTIQRCVSPNSKLYAQRWFPRTALTELTAISLQQFNNTRIHRVLEQLDEATDSLMRRLPTLYLGRQNAFASLFMDVTDTWFVGDGSPGAQSAKTKEGMYRKKIGIVLLCNEHGYPIRWKVIPGRQHDSVAMSAMLQDIKGLRWLGDAPLVMDRAMGKSAHIRSMLGMGIRFLTALTTTEFGSYTEAIPTQDFTQFDIGTQDDKQDNTRLAALGRLAVGAGMQEYADDLYVLDLGVHQMPDAQQPQLLAVQSDKTIDSLRLGTEVDRLMRENIAPSYSTAGKRVGLSSKQAHRCRALTRLTQDIQNDIQQGKACGVAINELLRLVELAPDQQQKQFAVLTKKATSKPSRHRTQHLQTVSPCASTNDEPRKVRLVAYFNPDMFLQQRRAAVDARLQIEQFVDELNTRSAEGRSRRKSNRLAGIVTEKLRKHEMLDAFDFDIIPTQIDGNSRLQVRLHLNHDAWAKRRRYDGFSVLIGHSELTQSASALCKLYRDKDAIEKDFQCIKSLVKVRPVWHHTDPKVRAHVTLCMLALLLERTLTERLNESKHCDLSAREALAVLDDCRLNYYAHRKSASTMYLCTELSDEQQSILRALRMMHLANDAKIADRITPRQLNRQKNA